MKLEHNQGSGRFSEIDAPLRRTVIEASGTASGGQSTAAATVVANLTENGAGPPGHSGTGSGRVRGSVRVG